MYFVIQILNYFKIEIHLDMPEIMKKFFPHYYFHFLKLFIKLPTIITINI